MMYDFTTMPNRHGKDSIAVDLQENSFWTLPNGTTRAEFAKIPMWIADMNFATAPSVTSHISKRVAHSIFGYFVPSEEYYHSIINWHKDSFGTTDLSTWNIGYENGVLGGITSALHILNPEHEPVLMHSPTYTGFSTQMSRNGYPMVLSSLIEDEIWSDLTLFGHKHIPTQSVSEDAKQRTIAFYSPSKTFNLAGLVGSYHIIYNQKTADALRQYESKCHGKTLDDFLCKGIKVGVLWRDGRQFHIPYGIRLALGLPTKKLEEVFQRLEQYVL